MVWEGGPGGKLDVEGWILGVAVPWEAWAGACLCREKLTSVLGCSSEERWGSCMWSLTEKMLDAIQT